MLLNVDDKYRTLRAQVVELTVCELKVQLTIVVKTIRTESLYCIQGVSFECVRSITFFQIHFSCRRYQKCKENKCHLKIYYR